MSKQDRLHTSAGGMPRRFLRDRPSTDIEVLFGHDHSKKSASLRSRRLRSIRIKSRPFQFTGIGRAPSSELDKDSGTDHWPSVAKNATSPELLIETLSTDVRNELPGFVLGVIPPAVPVKTSCPPPFTKAALAAVPALLITGSRKPWNAGLFVSAMTLMPLAVEKMPSLPSAGNPRKTMWPDALISELPQLKEVEGSRAVSTMAVSGPPLPVKIACEAKPFRRPRKTTVPDSFIPEMPKNAPPTRPSSFALAIVFSRPPSPVAMIASALLVAPSRRNRPFRTS